MTIDTFIAKWAASGAAERANAQLFVAELCALLGLDPPQPKTPDESANAYVFEKTIPGAGGNSNFIDCYKRGCFVLESKQGADADTSAAPLSEANEQRRARRKAGHGRRGTAAWDTAMEKARKQAENYARRLPREEIAAGGRPPFLMVVDVGHSIALYADWSRAGGHYIPFPDPQQYRIRLEELRDEAVRERLRLVWTDPLALDPSRRSARVTRQIADRLARLARSLEGRYEPERVAGFLMRSLFTMFAEDVGLLPEHSFTRLLDDTSQAPFHFPHMLGALWKEMQTGGYSIALRAPIPRFNGGLFAETDMLDLDADQIQLLAEAAQADWREVEPAIFGTLLERALDPRERHKLGAHYTPRAYVERAWCSPPSSNPCAPSGRACKRPPYSAPTTATPPKPSAKWRASCKNSPACASSTRPAAAATSSTSPSNCSNASKARPSTPCASSARASNASNWPA